MAFIVHARSGVVDSILTIIIDFVLLYFIGRLLSIVGLIVDLRKLNSNGRLRLRETELPVAGSMRNTMGGCIAAITMMLFFFTILIAENGINGKSVEKWERSKFDEIRLVSINDFRQASRVASPRFEGLFEGSQGCMFLEKKMKVQYAEFRLLNAKETNYKKVKNVCSKSTDVSIRPIQVSSGSDHQKFGFSCKKGTPKLIGRIDPAFQEQGRVKGREREDEKAQVAVMRCNATLAFAEGVADNISEERIWFFNNSHALPLRRDSTSIVVT